MNTAAAASTIANAIAIMVGRLRPVARLRLLWVAAGRAPPELTDMSQIALPVRLETGKEERLVPSMSGIDMRDSHRPTHIGGIKVLMQVDGLG